MQWLAPRRQHLRGEWCSSSECFESWVTRRRGDVIEREDDTMTLTWVTARQEMLLVEMGMSNPKVQFCPIKFSLLIKHSHKVQWAVEHVSLGFEMAGLEIQSLGTGWISKEVSAGIRDERILELSSMALRHLEINEKRQSRQRRARNEILVCWEETNSLWCPKTQGWKACQGVRSNQPWKVQLINEVNWDPDTNHYI